MSEMKNNMNAVYGAMGVNLNETVGEEHRNESDNSIGTIKIVSDIELLRYISEDDMKNIAKKLFEMKIDEAITRRAEFTNSSLSDMILHKSVSELVKDVNKEKLVEHLSTKIDQIVHEKPDDGDEVNDFTSWVRSAVMDVINSYVKENKDMLTELYRHEIENAVKAIADKKVSLLIADKIAWQFNMRVLTAEAISKVIQENTKEEYVDE